MIQAFFEKKKLFSNDPRVSEFFLFSNDPSVFRKIMLFSNDPIVFRKKC